MGLCPPWQSPKTLFDIISRQKIEGFRFETLGTKTIQWPRLDYDSPHTRNTLVFLSQQRNTTKKKTKDPRDKTLARNLVTCSTNDKGSDIGIQEKKAKLFNEWERFTSTDRESIESYYHRFSKLMNDFKRNKHFPEKIATDNTQLYDFLKYNQKEVDELRAERLTKTQDPLALMANSNNSFKYPVFHPDLRSSSTYIQQPLPNNNYNLQPSFN
ncbi:hypothetical protein Tco_1476853 [Tanacetum coccineum]